MKSLYSAAFMMTVMALPACSGSSFEGGAKPMASAPRASASSSGSSGTPTTDSGATVDPGTDGQATAATPTTPSNDTASGSPKAVLATTPPPPSNINFGLLVNDFNCTFCHMEVHGTVVSVGDAEALREDSNGKVFGKWLVAGAYHAADILTVPPRLGGIVVAGGITQNYDNSGKEMPISAATGKPGFPILSFTDLAGKMQGSLSAKAAPSTVASISKVYTGNALLVGTAAAPIVIDKDVLVNGDVVIKGVFTGVGTIYATGNIYIPANLKAAHLASLPYSDDAAAANIQAKADLAAASSDGLGLASAKSIFVGDLENYMDSGNGRSTRANGLHGIRYNSIYTNDQGTPFTGTVNGVWNVYNWLPEAQFEALYETLTPCWTASDRPLVAGHSWGERTFTQIDAYLYAVSAVAGINRASSWTLNGGVISQSMHIVSGADSDRINANGSCHPARINFDYRLQNGLQSLEQVGALFAKKS